MSQIPISLPGTNLFSLIRQSNLEYPLSPKFLSSRDYSSISFETRDLITYTMHTRRCSTYTTQCSKTKHSINARSIVKKHCCMHAPSFHHEPQKHAHYSCSHASLRISCFRSYRTKRQSLASLIVGAHYTNMIPPLSVRTGTWNFTSSSIY